MDAAPVDRQSKKRGNLFVRLGVSVVMAGLAGIGGFFYLKYQEVLNAPTLTQKLVDRLSSVIELPAETPTLLTIADKSKLSNPALASQVDTGDQLLVFNEAKKIIVYRPSSQKAIAILTIQTPVSPEATIPAPTRP